VATGALVYGACETEVDVGDASGPALGNVLGFEIKDSSADPATGSPVEA